MRYNCVISHVPLLAIAANNICIRVVGLGIKIIHASTRSKKQHTGHQQNNIILFFIGMFFSFSL